ncbi:MAG: DUF4215 domain-containing protein [Myxococcaceae bacterium]
MLMLTHPKTVLAAVLGLGVLLTVTGCPAKESCVGEECVAAQCGDGKKEGAEACDDGNLLPGDGCEADCSLQPTTCGDAVVEGYEQCDDANLLDGDGCQKDCQFTPSVCGNGTRETTEECDDGNKKAKDGCESDCTLTLKALCGNGVRDGKEACDDGNDNPDDACQNDCTFKETPTEKCPGASLPLPPAGTTCTVTAGNASRLYTGVVLTPGKIFQGGQVLVDGNGVIQCAACDCSAAAVGATQVVCPAAVISPGLINLHDHITFQSEPFVFTDGGTEKFEHRHDWRKGQDGHSLVPQGPNATPEQIRWAELRQVMAGTTSIVGSGGQKGFLRNLDRPSAPQADGGTDGTQEGLEVGANGSKNQTFPLGDGDSGAERTADCNYASIASASEIIPANAAYLPHVAEGIEASARNEFVCLSPIGTGKARDQQGLRTAMVHGIGLRASDISLAVNQGTGLVWSPRSNLFLYGDTATVQTYYRLGATVALGTDWVRSGSMNLLRELQCASYLNESFYGRPFSQDGLWRMVTVNAAALAQASSKLGTLEKGMIADLAIFRLGDSKQPYLSVIAAKPEDVVLTVRGGKVLYGDAPVVAALSAEACDALTVCGAAKSACVASEIGVSLAKLEAQNAGTYGLFFCNQAPANEPVCSPSRVAPWTANGSNTYTGVPAAGDSDGDGILDGVDNCAKTFNSIRPLDDGKQADLDGDGIGDVCDLCPLGAGGSCKRATPVDLDGDGIKNTLDNCTADYNPDQTDADGDRKGDACDPCAAANPGSMACNTSVYEVKKPFSKLMGQRVTVSDAVVTAVLPSGFFVQVDPSGPGYPGVDNSALFIFLSGSPVKVGDKVVVSGLASEYFDQVQISNAAVTVTSPGNALPAPLKITPAELMARARVLEGVLVQLSGMTVVNANPAPGSGDSLPTNEYEVAAGLRVNDLFFALSPPAEAGEQIASLTGIFELRNGSYKVEPRSVSDYLFTSTSLLDLAPAQTFVRVGGAGGTLPDPLTLRLRRPLPGKTTVALRSSSGNLTLPASVELPGGETRVTVALTGSVVTPSATVYADFNGKTLTSNVRVLSPTETGKLVSLSPSPAQGPAGGKAQLSVNLDIPALADTPVSLSLSNAAFGTVPDSVIVKANQLSARFEVSLDKLATGSATVTAIAGDLSVTQTVNMVLPQTGVVISEVAVANVDKAGDEFVELYNTTGADIDVSGWKLQYKSATGLTYQEMVTIPSGRIIPSRGYLLLASREYAGEVSAEVTWNNTALGGAAGHVRLGRNNMGLAKDDANVVDSLGYGAAADSAEGNAPAAPPRASMAGSLERKAKPTSTVESMTPGGADLAAGNGYDTNNSANDFVVRAAREPQNTKSAVEKP